jgi:hypothetical protein
VKRWLVVLAALAGLFAWPMQVTGYNQNAHYALVRALAVYGTPWIDRSRNEIGDLSTRDAARYGGHWYAAKAPGLAVLSLPAFVAVKAVGARTTGDPTRVLWALHLWGAALPALVIMLLVRSVGDRLEPGFGRPAAITAGLATLVLPFATLFFAHVAAAAFGFAAFALLVRERTGPHDGRLVFVAGLLAGLAVFVDYPLAIAAALVAAYAASRLPHLRRLATYSAGGAVGVLPLLLFNWWAFGSPTHIAYEDYYSGGKAGGIFGFGLPSASHARDLLFSTMGILVLTPVVAAAAAGAVLLLRRRRPEALLVLGVAAAYFLWNTSLRYASPFGGLGPPRYLLPLVPFLAVGLAVAYRRFPLTTLALAAVSAFQMIVITATGPLAAYDGGWMRRLTSRQFVETAASLLGFTGWYAIIPFFLAAAVAAVGCIAFLGLRGPDRADVLLAVLATAAWAVLALLAENPSGHTLGATYVLALAAAAAAGSAIALAGAPKWGRLRPVT